MSAAAASNALPRLLVPSALTSWREHLAWFGAPPATNRALIGEVDRAGLRGRGGAGFPTATKLAAVAARGKAIVVANGTEGEPASAKDKALMSLAPHLVLDGVVAAAAAVGAREAVVCVDRAAASTAQVISAAIEERRQAGVDPIAITLATPPSRYIAGEESALVHWLNGGEAKPTLVPPRPFERGVRRRSTLVQNVETLAHLALIARFGAEWFRTVGTAAEPGTVLLTVLRDQAAMVVEAELGSTLVSALTAAGADVDNSSAVLVGGYFGTWLPASSARGLLLTAESLAGAGASIGCGALALLPAGACGLAESALVTKWLADETAGQCGPCVHGLGAIAEGMAELVRGDGRGGAETNLRRWLGMVKGRGACRHPDGAARFVESSLNVFAHEIVAHRRRGGPCAPAPPLLPTPAPAGWR